MKWTDMPDLLICTEGSDTKPCQSVARYVVTTDDSSTAHYTCKRHLVAAVEQFMDTFDAPASIERIT